jgi:hypothetical protein
MCDELGTIEDLNDQFRAVLERVSLERMVVWSVELKGDGKPEVGTCFSLFNSVEEVRFKLVLQHRMIKM